MNVYEPTAAEVMLRIALGRIASGTYKDYVERLGLRGSERVLDVGCGFGNSARYLAPILQRGGGTLTCVDTSKTWLRLAQRWLGRYPNVTFRLGELAALDMPAASFEVVVLDGTLHATDAGQRPALVRQLARILTDGGRLFIREPLRFIKPKEIRVLMAQNGLFEIDSTITMIATQGEVYEGVFRKLNTN